MSHTICGISYGLFFMPTIGATQKEKKLSHYIYFITMITNHLLLLGMSETSENLFYCIIVLLTIIGSIIAILKDENKYKNRH